MDTAAVAGYLVAVAVVAAAAMLEERKLERPFGLLVVVVVDSESDKLVAAAAAAAAAVVVEYPKVPSAVALKLDFGIFDTGNCYCHQPDYSWWLRKHR